MEGGGETSYYIDRFSKYSYSTDDGLYFIRAGSEPFLPFSFPNMTLTLNANITN